MVDLDSGRLVWVARGKKGASLKPFWRALRKAKAKIQAVCCDLSTAYWGAVVEHLPKAMRLTGLFRRISNSLFVEWRRRQKKPRHKTSTDFFSAMNAEHHRYAIRCLHARQPSFQTAA